MLRYWFWLIRKFSLFLWQCIVTNCHMQTNVPLCVCVCVFNENQYLLSTYSVPVT